MSIDQEVKKIEGEAKQVVTKVESVDITDAEKFIFSKLENDYLKAQMEMKRLGETIRNVQETYPKKMEEMAKKYAVDLKTWVFDGMDYAFKKKP